MRQLQQEVWRLMHKRILSFPSLDSPVSVNCHKYRFHFSLQINVQSLKNHWSDAERERFAHININKCN